MKENNEKVFLVGIDGIGISAVAKYLVKEGYKIFGSDIHRGGKNVQELKRKYGLSFFEEDDVFVFENLPASEEFEFLIYTAAADPEKHKIIQTALQKNIPIYTYAEYLGKMSRDKFTISVAGTNGKTTTTTMLTEAMYSLGLEPSAIAGGIMKKFGSNFLFGKSDTLILESCEYKNSFLNLYPNIAVITNITPDHLDFFGTFEEERESFVKFIENIKESGTLVCNPHDKNLVEVIQKAQEKNLKIIDYTKFLINLNLNILGEYNKENAAAVLAVISQINNSHLSLAKKYLEDEFVSAERRMDFLGKTKQGAEVYDDYAHNPEAIQALIFGVKEKWTDKKVVIVFQPHLYSRTKDFQDEFAGVLSLADEIYLPPIYSAREKDDPEISSEILAKKMTNRNVQTCKSLEDCVSQIREKQYNKNTIIITVGAGDVHIVGENLVK